jgi:hypothetical protein
MMSRYHGATLSGRCRRTPISSATAAEALTALYSSTLDTWIHGGALGGTTR